MSGARAFLGSLEAMLGSDTGLHGTCIPVFLSIHVNKNFSVNLCCRIFWAFIHTICQHTQAQNHTDMN